MIRVPNSFFLTILVAFVLLLGATGCKNESALPTEDVKLLVGVDNYPSDWKMYPARDNLEDDEGQESGAYIIFYYQNAPVMIRSLETIYHYSNINKAKNHFERFIDTYYNDSSVYRTSSWEVPIDFAYSPSNADEWKFACAGSNFSLGEMTGNERSICIYLARYKEYIVQLNTTVKAENQEYMTIAQLEDIIAIIDKNMGNIEK